jgi:hypothetical protein
VQYLFSFYVNLYIDGTRGGLKQLQIGKSYIPEHPEQFVNVLHPVQFEGQL